MAQVSALKRVVRKEVQLPSIAFARGKQDERLPRGADTKLVIEFEWDLTAAEIIMCARRSHYYTRASTVPRSMLLTEAPRRAQN